MTLKTDTISDLATFFNTDEFAETIMYTPFGGTAIYNGTITYNGDKLYGEISITVIREEMDPSIMSEAPPGDSIILLVKSADVSNPQRGDSFIINNETWYLIRNLGGGSPADVWKLEISRSDKRRL